MDINIITYLACICFIFIFGRIFIVPIKKILKLVLNSALGGVVIFIINVIGSNFGFHIGLNFFTSILIGLLGLPGVLCFKDVFQVLVFEQKETSLFNCYGFC